MQWQALCSHAIWVIVGIFAVPAALLQIGRGFYYLDCFPRFNRLCKCVHHVVNEIVSIFWECPAEFVIYATGVITIVAIAASKF